MIGPYIRTVSPSCSRDASMAQPMFPLGLSPHQGSWVSETNRTWRAVSGLRFRA